MYKKIIRMDVFLNTVRIWSGCNFKYFGKLNKFFILTITVPKEVHKGIYISHVLKIFIFIMGGYSLYKQDWIWAFASFFAFILSMSPLFIEKNFKISLPWIMELLIAIPLLMHVWGGVLGFYSNLYYYDKIAHFISSAIIAFLALIIIYVLDVYWEGLKMDLFMVGFFIVIFTIALGGIWEIGEFLSDILLAGTPKAQVSLDDTMLDLIYDSIAGIIVGVGGTIGIRRGDFTEIISQLGQEIKRETSKWHGKRFLQTKAMAMKSLNKALANDKVDKKARPILTLLNEADDFFTTSSCSGRIVVMEIPLIGKKDEAHFLGRWHQEVEVREIIEAMQKYTQGEGWLLVQSPIFHVSTLNMERAKELLRVALKSGFKNSGIKSFNGRVVVEICSTERLDFLFAKNGKMLYLELDEVVKSANIMIKRIKERLERLEKNISKKFFHT
jgi:tRNA wybutosine-synthesizing protein 3